MTNCFDLEARQKMARIIGKLKKLSDEKKWEQVVGSVQPNKGSKGFWLMSINTAKGKEPQDAVSSRKTIDVNCAWLHLYKKQKENSKRT